MKKIRIGQIGIGHNHGEAKMLAFRKFPEHFEIVGYAEEDPEWLLRRKDLPGYEGLPLLTVEQLLERCDALGQKEKRDILLVYNKKTVDYEL